MDSALVVVTFLIACCAGVATLRIIAERVDFVHRVAELRMQTERLRSGRRGRN